MIGRPTIPDDRDEPVPPRPSPPAPQHSPLTGFRRDPRLPSPTERRTRRREDDDPLTGSYYCG